MAKSLSFAFFCLFLCLYIISPTKAQIGGISVALIHRNSPKSPFCNHSETPQADIIPNRSNYLMRISIGTPPVEMTQELTLTWIQCEPCPQSQCFKQGAPFFDPKNSSTYIHKSCSKGNCTYSIEYKSSFSRGNYATEAITLGSTSGQLVALPKQSLVANTTMMEATSLQKLLALLALDVAILHLFRGWELQLQVNSRIA